MQGENFVLAQVPRLDIFCLVDFYLLEVEQKINYFDRISHHNSMPLLRSHDPIVQNGGKMGCMAFYLIRAGYCLFI